MRQIIVTARISTRLILNLINAENAPVRVREYLPIKSRKTAIAPMTKTAAGNNIVK